jgi:hypothetical protein
MKWTECIAREGKGSFGNLGIGGDNIVTDLINALPGNSSVNTVQHATIDKTLFYVVRTMPSAGNGPMNSQPHM